MKRIYGLCNLSEYLYHVVHLTCSSNDANHFKRSNFNKEVPICVDKIVEARV